MDSETKQKPLSAEERAEILNSALAQIASTQRIVQDAMCRLIVDPVRPSRTSLQAGKAIETLDRAKDVLERLRSHE